MSDKIIGQNVRITKPDLLVRIIMRGSGDPADDHDIIAVQFRDKHGKHIKSFGWWFGDIEDLDILAPIVIDI